MVEPTTEGDRMPPTRTRAEVMLSPPSDEAFHPRGADNARRYWERRANSSTPAEAVDLVAALDHTITMLATSGRSHTDELSRDAYHQLNALFEIVRGLGELAEWRGRANEKKARVQNVETGERL